MNHNGIFKALHCHNILRLDSLLHQLHQLHAGIVSRLLQLRSRCRHQGRSRKHQSQSLCHNLHGRSRSHKGACAAAGACVLFVIIQLLPGNLPSLFLGVKLSNLLQSQQLINGAGGILLHIFRRNGMCFHNAAGYYNRAHIL